MSHFLGCELEGPGVFDVSLWATCPQKPLLHGAGVFGQAMLRRKCNGTCKRSEQQLQWAGPRLEDSYVFLNP